MTREQARRWIGEECGYPGWLGLVDRVFDALPPHVWVEQVFQKWGSLRFDLEHVVEDEPFAEYVESIERLSTTICDTCGGAGVEHVVDGWERTICGACALRVAQDPAAISRCE
jgi:hypothetical protein